MSVPANSALAIERPNIFAAPVPRPRQQPRPGGIFADAARAETTGEAPDGSRAGRARRLSRRAAAIFAVIAVAGSVVLAVDGDPRAVERETTPAHRDVPLTRSRPSAPTQSESKPALRRERRQHRTTRRARVHRQASTA